VIEAHVDGFRIDLASVLGRDSHGRVVADAPLLERIAEDPILRDTKLIAEAWDIAGAYQVGSFSQRRWAEWNGRFRDDVRRFWRGDPGMLGAFASRLAGSSDLYEPSAKGPECSINFVTCHDGFTLEDLVSYDRKHNEANGEANRDGADENYSASYGVEGPTSDPEIAALRTRQIKNFIVTLAVSRGVPMLLAGDELRRTQRGNNNAYCQDNEISWLDWSRLAEHGEIHRFVRAMLAFRRANPVLSREAFYADRDVTWFSPDGRALQWDEPDARQLGCLLRDAGAPAMCLAFNADRSACDFAIPSALRWRAVVDTSRAADVELGVVDARYRLAPHASAVLVPER
jgi:glycogen operon protein